LAPALASLKREFAGRARVLLIYIAEAHAADEWPINSARCAGPRNSVAAPTSLAERRAVAARMCSALPALTTLPLLVDGLDDAFLRTFAAWPVRLYGVRRGVLERIGQPQDAAVELPPFREWLLEVA
jgi:hypothetical protein